MKVADYIEYGSPEVLRLREIKKPVPKDNELLIKVFATTVSSGDARLRRADPFLVRLFNGLTRPKKMTVLGNELAGRVEAVGKEITQFKGGDYIFGQAANLGAHAEYICLTEGEVADKPANLSFEEAAAIPFGGNTALHFLKKGEIQPGQKVLIYGASGSVGTAAVQLARYFGAEVTGVCSTANIELVESLGADTVIDYTSEDFTKRGQKYDIIFDTVGKSPFAGSIRSLKDSGRYVRAVHISPAAIGKGIWTSVTTNKKVIAGVAEERKENLEFLKERAEAGEFKPVIDRRYPFSQIVEAHRYVDNGHKKGNVVVTIEQ
jgi:NADPH:quinone reductase-like Zn-dependent oxidoreductase